MGKGNEASQQKNKVQNGFTNLYLINAQKK